MKIAQGTWRPDRANPAEPQPDPGVPPCPRELDREAKREWQRLAPQLLRLGLLAETDRAMFASYCQAWSTWARAQAELAKHGPVHITPNGHQQRSPWCSIGDEAYRQMERSAAHFGLSPASRTKVSALPHAARRGGPDRRLLAPYDDGFDALLDGADPAESFFQ